MTENKVSVQVVIHGRVQGVGYRAWTVGQARQRGLRGWVRNRAEGTVEAVFSGDSAAVESMIKACYEGPHAARVEGIDRRPCDEVPEGDFIARQTV